MAYLKIRHKESEGYGDGKYHDDASFQTVITYILNPEKTPSNYVGGIAVDVSHAVQQMEILSNCFGKNDGVHLRHMILAFEPRELSRSRKRSIELTYQLAYPIALYYGQHYQIVYAVHENTEKVHIHFVMNTTSYLTGLKYNGSREDYYRFIRHINSILAPYRTHVVPVKDREEWGTDPF